MLVKAHIDDLLERPPAALTRGKGAITLRVWGDVRARSTEFLELPGLERVSALDFGAEYNSPGRLRDQEIWKLTKSTRFALVAASTSAQTLSVLEFVVCTLSPATVAVLGRLPERRQLKLLGCTVDVDAIGRHPRLSAITVYPPR